MADASAEPPIVTFNNGERTFERIFKGECSLSSSWKFVADNCNYIIEQSLQEIKALIRAKLGLHADAALELAQVRDGRKIDLEDGAPQLCLFNA